MFCHTEELAEMRAVLEAKGDRSGYDRRYRDLPADEVARLEAKGASTWCALRCR
jgi:glutamyl/glutaminyl-tRNA synthetase